MSVWPKKGTALIYCCLDCGTKLLYSFFTTF